MPRLATESAAARRVRREDRPVGVELVGAMPASAVPLSMPLAMRCAPDAMSGLGGAVMALHPAAGIHVTMTRTAYSFGLPRVCS
jgi:hypothetical protein